MKFLVLAAVFAVATAQYDYSPPQRENGGSRPVYGPPPPGNPQPLGPQEQAPQVFKHVYVHVAPDEPEDRQSKVIRVPGGGDKHVNIIFVKTPSQNTQQQTEVILPEQDEHKNLVYVLLKKGESKNDVKIRGPAPKGPTKPEVFFIRYKNQEQEQAQEPQQGYGAPVSSAQAAPAPIRSAAQVPSSNYGAPF